MHLTVSAVGYEGIIGRVDGYIILLTGICRRSSGLYAVHSVMYLILTFFSAAGLFILMGAEFLALLLVMVYVGAVAVLFLFVVMMNVGFGLLVAGILLLEMLMVGATYIWGDDKLVVIRDDGVSNLEAFGRVLYTDYAGIFEAAGFVLLVAMIGAIVLTLRERDGVKKQDALKQMERTKETGMEMVDIEPGQGLG